MLNLKRDNLGFIELRDEDCDFEHGNIIYIDETKYFYKDCALGAYKELVVSELAQDFDIQCAYYDLATFSYRSGVISRDLNTSTTRFVTMYDMLSDFYNEKDYRRIKTFNNLDDIGTMFDEKFPHETSQKLLSQLDDIYLFDLLVGNADRNSTNYGILFSEESTDMVIIDNELSLDTDVIYNGQNLLTTGRDSDDLSEVSYDKVKEGLSHIESGQIEETFTRIEEKIQSTINEGIKCEFRTFFERSRTSMSQKIPKSSVKQI